MSPEQEQSFEGDSQKQKIQAMLGSITDAIAEEDYEFAAQTALGQEIISPADVVEYIHLQGKAEEDPVAKRRNIDGVNSIVASLRERDQAEVAEDKERSLSNEDVARINKVMQDIELQEMAENSVLAEEPDVDAGSYAEPNYEWDEDVFSADLSDYTDEEIEKAKSTIGFKVAMEEVEDTDFEPSARASRARDVIEQSNGKYKHLLLLILDGFIMTLAEEEAQDTDFEPYARASRARGVIENNASDRNSQDKPILSRMLASLDKFIAKAAAEEAEDTDFEPYARASRARTVITQCASSPERVQAMLDELGL